MKLILLAVGKAHDANLKAAINDYSQRLTHYFGCEWRLVTPSKHIAPDDIKKQEAEAILKTIGRDDVLILLDERGQNFTSPQLAALLQEQANRSAKTLIFAIGGAYGVAETVRKRADFTWSLSRLVFPHQIVRLILAEQLYRAGTILRHENYHHD